MTREDAIYEIRQLAVLSTNKNIERITEALNMAIEALTMQYGEWVNSVGKPIKDNHSVYCSICGEWSEYRSDFCPNCGAEIADRKTESSSEKPNNSTKATISKMEQVDTMSCQECKHFHENAVMYLDQCDFCFKDCNYEPKDEPQTDFLVKTPSKSRDGHEIADAPLTDAEITELAKEIVHKMIDNSVIAEDAYPDLRQRMHEAVERLGEYYSSENERSE